ncbi:ribosome biogenesis GTPase YlqF [Paenibacillus sp. y28]|uniref:ribosome biogenesis GTPase YlqF n=1 Tax=Paenibacillus sp. y28 TaxID=3129110 RepID=UPI0030196759
MTIQWFPGHMTRARREIEAKLKLIDVVIELLDARIPLSSRNPMIDEIVKSKPRLVLLNKTDLADGAVTQEWVDYFARQELQALPIDAATGTRVKEIPVRLKQMLAEKREKLIAKGVNPRAIRTLIVGIPNVGKSTLINRLAGRNIAATGDKPGVTKGQQWIKMGSELELLDTPGILWPKFEDQNVGYRLAATGAIKDDLLYTEDVAFFAMKHLIARYPAFLAARYDLKELPEGELEADQIVQIMEQIGRRRGCIQSGGSVNLEKASMLILRELRAGTIGRITMETPED